MAHDPLKKPAHVTRTARFVVKDEMIQGKTVIKPLNWTSSPGALEELTKRARCLTSGTFCFPRRCSVFGQSSNLIVRKPVLKAKPQVGLYVTTLPNFLLSRQYWDLVTRWLAKSASSGFSTVFDHQRWIVGIYFNQNLNICNYQTQINL